ncbi:Caspase-7, partial [Lamellibrachia satsuma]
ISVDDITAMFDGKYCPKLINKPKIFIFQACRGDIMTSGVPTFQADSDVTNVTAAVKQMSFRDSPDVEPIPKIHAKADMIKAFSAVSDHISWRHTREGSWFINDLVDTFAEHAYEDDIVHLLTEVRRRMTKRVTSDEFIGLSNTDEQLTKKLYFFPGYAKPCQNDTPGRSDSIQATN